MRTTRYLVVVAAVVGVCAASWAIQRKREEAAKASADERLAACMLVKASKAAKEAISEAYDSLAIDARKDRADAAVAALVDACKPPIALPDGQEAVSSRMIDNREALALRFLDQPDAELEGIRNRTMERYRAELKDSVEKNRAQALSDRAKREASGAWAIKP